MNIKASLSVLITAPIITFAALPLSAQATDIEIGCSLKQGLPTVLAKSTSPQQAEVTILQFLPDYFSVSTGFQNCEKTAQVLQKLNESGTKGYLTSELIDGQSVVCTVARRGLGCDSLDSQHLFSFAPEREPSQALYQMLGEDLKPAQPITTRTLGRIYTKIDRNWWDMWRF